MTAAALPREAALPWRTHLATLALAWLGLLLLFHRDVADMVLQWWNSSTYAHCLLLVPIIGWLVHQRRAEVAELTPQGWWPGLLWSGGGALLWLLGELGGIALFRHAGLIAMLQGAVAATLGQQVTRGLLFPLFYMAFLVPFGEELVPPMQTITAKLSMLLLGWTGIPAHIDGVFITTPNGYFEVAEACSGVKFLVAMAAYAVLVTNLCFKSWPRRIAFLVMALIVPVIANGIRAYGTILIAEKTGIAFAASFDHIVYGWIFFGLVMALVMLIGWRFFDRRVADPMIEPARIPPQRGARIGAVPAAAAALLIAAAVSGWAYGSATAADTLPRSAAAPRVPGWTPISPQGGHPWLPRFDQADRLYHWRYRKDDGGQELDLVIAAFASQHEGKELVGFGQGALDTANQWAWSQDLGSIGAGQRAVAGQVDPPGQFDQYTAPGPVTRTVASWYRVGGQTITRKPAVKLATLKQRLLAGDQHAAAILISAERHPGEVQPETLIADFLRAAPGVGEMADGVLGE